MEADTLIADKAFDADARVLEPLAAAGKTTVIPPRSNRSLPRDYDRELYAARHLIENFFAKIKQFRAIATRYEKTARNFLAAIQLVASVVWLIDKALVSSVIDFTDNLRIDGSANDGDASGPEAGEGWSDSQIAAALDTSTDTVARTSSATGGRRV